MGDIDFHNTYVQLKKNNKILTKQQKEENIAEWTLFYRNNLDLFNRDVLGLKLKEYQDAMIMEMAEGEHTDIIASRGSSKKNINKESEVYLVRLTKEQKNFINNNYANMSNREIAEKLGLDYSTIRNYGKNNKLKKNPLFNNNIRLNYFLNKDYSYICDSVCLLDEPKSENLYKSKYGKYYINQDYFCKIDNEWKAYWLGFLYADGCNHISYDEKKNKYTYSLSLSLKRTDYKHIIKLQNSLQTDNNYKFREVKCKNKIFEDVEVQFHNKKICIDLNKNGCTPRKSLTLKYPSSDILPKELNRHFIRGYFDGDGCIHINLNGKNKKTWSISFVGTENMLINIVNIINEELNVLPTNYNNNNGISQNNSKNNNTKQICYSDLEKIEKIFEYFYKDSNIFLDRKFEKFKVLFN